MTYIIKDKRVDFKDFENWRVIFCLRVFSPTLDYYPAESRECCIYTLALVLREVAGPVFLGDGPSSVSA